jgi:hypothetical protein
MKDLVIKDCEPKFAIMIVRLYHIYNKKAKCSCEINFSGSPTEFKYIFNKVDPDLLFETEKVNLEQKKG